MFVLYVKIQSGCDRHTGRGIQSVQDVVGGISGVDSLVVVANGPMRRDLAVVCGKGVFDLRRFPSLHENIPGQPE